MKQINAIRLNGPPNVSYHVTILGIFNVSYNVLCLFSETKMDFYAQTFQDTKETR